MGSVSENILLVEAGYHNKLPPLGLMKLATFHKERGDYVRFVKGKSVELRRFDWDRVYITTLFTFEWKRTVETIKFYQRTQSKPVLLVGGVLATLMASQLRDETGATVVEGLLDSPAKLGLEGEENIDRMVPDYSILDDVDYDYPVKDAYIIHATRGCVRRCSFCAVPTIEPKYESFLSVADQVEAIRVKYGEQRDLVLMDNNTLASPRFAEIVDEIVEAGFGRGARLGRRPRYVDFNQGLDARLMTREKMALLGRLNVRPVRIAFDSLDVRDEYIQAIRWAAEEGFIRLSNYVLYNCDDTPEDFYTRLRINIDLNQELGTQIFSFPMRYSPIEQVDRKYIGDNWTWRYVRGVQCILNATRGVVGIGHDFFLRAFGDSPEAFVRLISMPEEYIMHRTEHDDAGAKDWRADYDSLSTEQLDEFRECILHSRLPVNQSADPVVRRLLAHY
jgi:hypothetical protein